MESGSGRSSRSKQYHFRKDSSDSSDSSDKGIAHTACIAPLPPERGKLE